MTFKIGIPLIEESTLEMKFEEHWDLKTEQSKTTTASQTITVQEEINVHPETCTEACVMGKRQSIQLPYTIVGTYTGRAAELGEEWAGNAGAVCCYLRPGGSADCGVFGHGDPDSKGWHLSASPGQMATDVAHPHITDCGDGSGNACARIPGQMTGGMQMKFQTYTYEYPPGGCPADSDSCTHPPTTTATTTATTSTAAPPGGLVRIGDGHCHNYKELYGHASSPQHCYKQVLAEPACGRGAQTSVSWGRGKYWSRCICGLPICGSIDDPSVGGVGGHGWERYTISAPVPPPVIL